MGPTIPGKVWRRQRAAPTPPIGLGEIHAFEIFGGVANMKYVVITGALDDSLDYDEGWQGNVQFLVIRQTALTGGPDRLVEASNRVVSSTAPGTLQTNPTIANFTMIGLPTNSSNANLNGVEMNNTGGTPGSSGRWLNGVVTGSTTCLNVTNANTSPAPRVDSVLFDCPGAYAAAATTVIGKPGMRKLKIVIAEALMIRRRTRSPALKIAVQLSAVA